MNKKKVVVFLYANTPNPALIERAMVAEKTGLFKSFIVYWGRQNSDISIPFSKLLPNDRFLEIQLGDPRGNFFRRIYLSLKFSVALRAILNDYSPNVIYAVNPDMLGLSWVANLFRAPISVVYDFQDQKGEHLNIIYRNLYRLSASNVTKVFIRSRGFLHHIKTNKLFKKQVPVSYFAEAPMNWTLTKKNFPKFGQKLVLGYFGNIRGKLQIYSLLTAIGKLNSQGRKIEVKFAGVGSEAAWVGDLSKKLGYVHYLGPFDYFKEYSDLFISADLVFAVYPTDLANNKFHEARRFHESIATGIPLLVSSGTYMAKRVATLNVGWTVKEDSSDEIYEILEKILNDPKKIRGKRLTKALRKEHLIEHYTDDFIEALNEA